MSNYTWNIKGKLFTLDKPIVMGIINCTPDSFYDGNAHQSIEQIILKASTYIQQGASILDIGGVSTKPNANAVSPKEELSRIIPVIKQLANLFPQALLSVDTQSAEVAAQAISDGAHIINDVSAGQADEQMLTTVAQLKVPYIIMHMQGTPTTMQNKPSYQHVVKNVFTFLHDKIHKARTCGINDLAIDVGFGFGKTMEHNYQLLNHINYFNQLRVPQLVGVSRKSMLYNLLNTDAQHALNATTVAHTIALMQGAHILRVHDVAEAIEAITITQKLQQAKL